MKSDKVTWRWYEDACGAAHALDLLGERWALLVVRELMFGPKRFADLRAGLPGISANVLTQRLVGLEAAGVLRRNRLPPPASTPVYELTPWGYESEPIFQVLGRWAARSPAHDPTLPFSAASCMLSLRTMFDPARAVGLRVRVGLRFGPETFRADVTPAGIAVTAGNLDGADIVFAGAPATVAGAIYGGQSLKALEAAGLLTIVGDFGLAERFVTLFPLPMKAAAADARSSTTMP